MRHCLDIRLEIEYRTHTSLTESERDRDTEITKAGKPLGQD